MEIYNLSEKIDNMTDNDIIDYFNILNELTTVYQNKDELKKMVLNFKDYIKSLPNNDLLNKTIFLCYYQDKLIGTASLIIETKIIHNYGKVGMIEDVVITNSCQGKGFGKKLIHFLINKSNENKCYKTILTCNDKNLKFYQKCTPENIEIKFNNNVSYYLLK